MIKLNEATAEELGTALELREQGFETVRYSDDRGRFTEVRQVEEVPSFSCNWQGAQAHVLID